MQARRSLALAPTEADPPAATLDFNQIGADEDEHKWTEGSNPYRFSTVAAAVFALSLYAVSAWAQVNIDPDERYDQNVYLCAHNSFANYEEGYQLGTANQTRSVTRQIDQGATCLLPDVYLMRQHHDITGWRAEIYFGNDPSVQDSDFQDEPLKIVVAHNPTSSLAGYKLLIDYPFNDPFRSFVSYLSEVRFWMDAHPNVIVTLVLESYVARPDIMQQQFVDSGLIGRMFFSDRPNGGIPAPDGSNWDVRKWGWPTLRQMADYHRTLVVFSSKGVQPGEQHPDGLTYQWGSMVENVYGDDSLSPFTSFNARSASTALTDLTYPLFSMNYFPTFHLGGPDPLQDNPALGFWNFGLVNSANALAGAAGNNSNQVGRYPNFIAVDYYDTGETTDSFFLSGPTQVVYLYNQLWSLLPIVTPTLSGDTPNAAGWFNHSPTLTFSGTGVYPDSQPASVAYVVLTAPDGGGGYDHSQHNAPHDRLFPEGISEGTFSALAADHASRSHTAAYTVKVDTTAPGVDGQLFSQRNTNGWFKEPVSFTITGTDSLSGVDFLALSLDGSFWVSTPGDTFTGMQSAEGVRTLYFRSIDIAGNVSGTKTLSINIDSTPPTLAWSASPGPNGDGWNNTPVDISYLVNDNLAGVDSADPASPLHFAAEGTGQMKSVKVTDKAGNSGEFISPAVNIDLTPPTITGAPDRAPNGSGWYNADVTVTFTATDALSGVKSVSPPITLTSNGANQSVTGTAMDKAGNSASAAVSGINIDKTGAAITISANPSVLWPPNGKMVPVTISGSMTDALSGIDPASVIFAVVDEYGAVQPSGGVAVNVDGRLRFTVNLEAKRNANDMDGRQYTIIVRALDKAGNAANAQVVVTVPRDQG